MRIATWNINSVRTREQRVRDFLERSDVDVLCLQETKCTDAQFPDFTDTGYEQAHFGLHSFNGVAILSRVGLENVSHDFGQPGFDKDLEASQDLEARAIGAECGGVTVWSLYVPNGREIHDPHYTYKLAWLDALRNHITLRLAHDPAADMMLAGDWNVAQTDDEWIQDYFNGPRGRAAQRSAEPTSREE